MVESNDIPVDPGPKSHRVDPEQLTVAGVYDYFLGGFTNTASERRFGDRILAAFPLVRAVARANRAFLHRAVRHLMRLGVRQFVDIGAGLPTVDSTHTVADGFASGAAKVVYVDNDPVTVAHARRALDNADPARHAVVHADLRAPDPLWRKVADTGLVDLSEPVGLLIIAVLHLRQPGDDGDDVAAGVLARYRELLPTGSYLAISHATTENVPAEVRSSLSGTGQLYGTHTRTVLGRSHREISEFFGDFELVAPGVTWAPLWHPEEHTDSAPDATFATPGASAVIVGVGRKA